MLDYIQFKSDPNLQGYTFSRNTTAVTELVITSGGVILFSSQVTLAGVRSLREGEYGSAVRKSICLNW